MPKHAQLRIASLAAVCFGLIGCATSPEISEAPKLELPSAWTTEASAEYPENWLADFKSPELNSLVNEALQNNPDLQASAARFDQAIAEARMVGAERLPTAGLGLNGTRQRISTFGPSSTGGVRFDNYDLSLNLSWELDLWGQLSDRSFAAIAQSEASQADLIGARLSLAAQVAKSWFNNIEAQEQLRLAEATAKADADNLRTIEARFQRGLSEGLEVRQIRTQKALSEADIEVRRRAHDSAARSLETLLGRYPDASAQAGASMPKLAKSIPAGLPSSLLTRRPDLVSAERTLIAADRELLATRKDLLPKIGLTASGGTSSQDFQDLLNSNFSVWSLGANLTQPIFQGGRIRANIDRSQALKDQATANYRATALRAFLEVESTLAAERYLQREHTLLTLAAKEAEASEALAWKRYRDGTSDFLNFLSSQRAANAARSRLINLRNLLLQNRVDLYLALGGSFENES
ncbi:MAG: efflux transporter outer membrane subunit [Opitutaceae bacterium]